jgi:sugar O-acyltransferase (sialic acid O-acetyltransferase NeuD family)
MFLGIYGAGGLGREILDLAKGINALENKWKKIVFINDFKQSPTINGVEVFTFEEFKTNFSTDNARLVIAVGEPKDRQTLREKITASGYRLQSLIHPTASVGTETQIGDGTIVQFGSFVACNVITGINVLLLQNSSIGHDSIIDNDTVVSPHAAISGNCTIGERVYVGGSVPVKEKTSIGADSIIGMGSVVLRNIPENVIALGNPARAMKNNESGHVFK